MAEELTTKRCRCPGCQGPGKCYCCDSVALTSMIDEAEEDWTPLPHNAGPFLLPSPTTPSVTELRAQLAAATQHVAALTVLVDQARAVLDDVQWDQSWDHCGVEGYCPICLNYRCQGHKEDCRLAGCLAALPTPAPVDAGANESTNKEAPVDE